MIKCKRSFQVIQIPFPYSCLLIQQFKHLNMNQMLRICYCCHRRPALVTTCHGDQH